MNAQAIPYAQGNFNAAGVTRYLYAFVADILTFPVLPTPANATTMEALVNITTAIVMKPGKCFKEIYGTLGEGKLDCNQVGVRDGKSFENMVEFSHPGNTPTFLGFTALANNELFVLLVQEKNLVWRVVGTPDDPAYFEEVKGTSGAKAADGRVTKCVFKENKNTPPPIYTLPVASLLIPAA